MRNIPRYALMKRLLFPYSGEEELTRLQSLRVLLAWALFFPLLLSLLVVLFAFLSGFSWPRVLNVFLFALLSGACIFGLLGWLIVLVNNRSARIRRAWKAQKGR
jgi:hypothetical protein